MENGEIEKEARMCAVWHSSIMGHRSMNGSLIGIGIHRWIHFMAYDGDLLLRRGWGMGE